MDLDVIGLTKEEITAVFYADLKKFKQIDAAKKMSISQSSFNRELNSAHNKIVDALFNVKVIQFGDVPNFKLKTDQK